MKKLGLFLLVIFLVATTLSWAEVTTDTATVSWTPPTTNADGSLLTDLAGYRVYHRTGSTYATAGVEAGNVTSIQFIGLAEGTHCFVVTAYDTSNNESVYSNEVCRAVNFTITTPNPPVDVLVGP